MKNTVVSVIVPSRNSSETIQSLLKSLLNQSYSKRKYEVIVVDSSNDSTIEKISKFPVRIIRIKATQGRNSNISRNTGAEFANGKFFFFVDSDSAVEKNWISEIMREFSTPDVVCVGSNMQSRGNIFDEYVNISFKSPMRQVKEVFITTKKNFHKRQWPIGGNIAFRRDVFKKLGGFNPKLKYYEEVDLLWGICKKNYKIVLTPKTKVLHSYNRDFLHMMKTYLRYGKGCGHFLLKYFDATFSRIRLMTYIAILLFYSTFLFLAITKFENALLFAAISYLGLVAYYIKNKKSKFTKLLIFPIFDFCFIGIAFVSGMTFSFLRLLPDSRLKKLKN